jgi:hypothetical protein
MIGRTIDHLQEGMARRPWDTDRAYPTEYPILHFRGEESENLARRGSDNKGGKIAGRYIRARLPVPPLGVI